MKDNAEDGVPQQVNVLSLLYAKQTSNLAALMSHQLPVFFESWLALDSFIDLKHVLSVAVDLNDLTLFRVYLNMTADLMLAMNQVDKATFFFN